MARRLVPLLVLLVALAGCEKTDTAALARLRSEPILAPPPGATELLRVERPPTTGGIMAQGTSGFVRIVWACSQAPSELADYYRRAFTKQYQLEDQTAIGDREAVLGGIGLTTKLPGGAHLVVVKGTGVPDLAGEEKDRSRLRAAPTGTNSYATISVSSP